MNLLPTGTWEGLQARGLKVGELRQRLNQGDIPARAQPFPMRYQYLALEALTRGLISEGRFARLLNVDRLEASQIAQELQDQFGDGTEQNLIGDDPRRAVES
jgi:hypothetical protein